MVYVVLLIIIMCREIDEPSQEIPFFIRPKNKKVFVLTILRKSKTSHVRVEAFRPYIYGWLWSFHYS